MLRIIVKIVLVLISITILISVTILLVPSQDVGPAQVISDVDDDGVPDDKDFYDFGNGGVKISVTNFKGHCGNILEPCEPKFRLLADTDGDGEYDFDTSIQHGDTDEIWLVIEDAVDPSDDMTRMKFRLEIIDKNSLVGGDMIDYTANNENRWGYFLFDLTTGYWLWNEKGSEVPWCEITVSATVVGL